MDEEGATDHHNRHLIADVFGKWVAWWLSARRQTIEEERLSTNHFVLQQKGNFLYKLKCGVYLRNKKEFTTVLGLTMEDLLLKRKGMRRFSTFLFKQLGRWNISLRQEKWPTVQQNNSRRFLQRLKEKTRLRLKSSSSRRFRLNDVGSVKLKASAQKVMDKLLVLASVQTKQRELLQISQIHWSTMLQRSCLRESFAKIEACLCCFLA